MHPAKTQISLGIRPGWSESSLCAQWVAKNQSFLHADSEDSDQTGRIPGWSDSSLSAHSFCWFRHAAAHISKTHFLFKNIKSLMYMTLNSDRNPQMEKNKESYWFFLSSKWPCYPCTSPWPSGRAGHVEPLVPNSQTPVPHFLCRTAHQSIKTRQIYHLSRLTTKQQSGMCVQRRLRWIWASAQSDQGLRCSHEETFGH